VKHDRAQLVGYTLPTRAFLFAQGQHIRGALDY